MDSKKTQKIVVVILVVTALLGVLGALLVYYLSTQDRPDLQDRTRKEFCACITAYTTPDCNDCSCSEIETQTLESRMGEVIDGVCSLDCDVTPLETDTTPSEIKCLISSVREHNCHSVTIRNKNTKEPIIPPIPSDNPVLITADFVPRDFSGQGEEFTQFSFIINGIRTEINASEVETKTVDEQTVYTPEMEFSNFENVDTLTIQATASSDKEPEGTLPGRYCYKQYSLQQTRGAFCSNMLVYTQEDPGSNALIITQLELNTPNLTTDNDVSIEFTFAYENERDQTIRTKNIPKITLDEILVNETIFLEHVLLYSTPDLYVDGQGFPLLDRTITNADSVGISAQLYVNNNPVDSSLCRENVSLTYVTDEPDEDEDYDEYEEREEEEEEEEEEEVIDKPDIQVAMVGPTCVRKAADENSESRTSYRITVSNNSDKTEQIASITNKLPLGFEYIEGRTLVNNVLITDDILEVTSIGESQELVWTNNWGIEPNSTLTLEYAVNVTNKAIDGENQNEAVVAPMNIPQDMNKLRAEFVTTVGDHCEEGEEDLPDTGYLTIYTFAIGSLILILGTMIYQGRIEFIDTAILKLINAKIVKKSFMPKEYFEEKILEEDEKDKD